jgi:MoaA/NifB/PqqE/SkfB family radical SAM enzyme
MTRPLNEASKGERRWRNACRELLLSPRGFSRLLNLALAKFERRLGSAQMLAMPTSVAIEVTNTCNGGCLLCPVGQSRKSRPPGFMEWDLFRRLADEIAGHARFVGLYNWGEPFLHPRIYDMIFYVTEKRIYTKLSSNMHTFDPANAEKLVHTGLDELAVSLHGLSEESYRAYQPRHSLAEVINKVKTVVAAKNRLGSRTPTIHLGFIVTRHNEHEVEELPKLAAALGVNYLLQETSLNLRFLPQDRQMSPRNADEATLRQERLVLAEEWLPHDNRFVKPYYCYVRTHGGELPSVEQVPFTCESPWNQMIVCWDGDVNLCCGSFDKAHSVGNVFDQSVRQVWNNRFYQAARCRIRGRAKKDDPQVICNECVGGLL